ncbi:MAG: hypothetical protein KDK89_00960 [Alphaproteobacteria bacterium]|nr:hypothetical protein [Alphaproteobacteria bacterium]
MTEQPRFVVDAEGGWVMTRAVLGLAATAAALSSWLAGAGAMLVACVWSDAATGFVFRRRGPKSPSVGALETLADAACFVAAPLALLVAATEAHHAAIAVAPIFFLAAIHRMARFNVEGLAEGRYAGLPVTYNGYIFPAAAILSWLIPAWTVPIFAAVTLIVSGLMMSRRLSVPEW